MATKWHYVGSMVFRDNQSGCHGQVIETGTGWCWLARNRSGECGKGQGCPSKKEAKKQCIDFAFSEKEK